MSDFFTAYDLVPCRQQRCLVHLMRDFNEEIKNHPFDDELKLLAAEFSSVVKSVVETIDTYGFKKRHLRKHKKMAERVLPTGLRQRVRLASRRAAPIAYCKIPRPAVYLSGI